MAFGSMRYGILPSGCFRDFCNWFIEVDDRWPFLPYLLSSLLVPHSISCKPPTNSSHHILINLTNHSPRFAVHHQQHSHIASLVFPHASRNIVHLICVNRIPLFWITLHGTTYQVYGQVTVLCHRSSTGIVTNPTCESFDHLSSAPSINIILFTASTGKYCVLALKMMYTSIR